jgi:hypothetical protein
MKKILAGLLVLLLVFSLAGCGIKEKLEQKAGEAIVEKILDSAGVKADIDGDKLVVKGEDGEALTFGSGEWPTSDLAKTIPEFKGGKITGMLEAADSLYIMIEDISDEQFVPYLEEIKAIFSEEAYEMTTGDSMMYGATNGSNISVMITYEKDAGFSITLSKSES